MAERRYTVLTVEGWQICNGAKQSGRPGLSATIIDTLTGREVKTYRSEAVPRWTCPPNRRTHEALRLARAHARELNRSEAA